jgi:preprotein translocase subunit SecE
MADSRSTDGRKWINGLVALGAFVCAFYVILFIGQMGEWFDLEAKVSNFKGIAQGIGVLIGLLGFVYVVKSEKCSTFLNEVFAELVKVVWPDKDSVVKLTIGIIIALAICSVILFFIDYLSRQLLGLFY